MTGLTGGALGGGDAATRAAAMQLGLVMSAGDYILLGVSLFFGILTALSIALILGSFAEDAKSAQGVVAPLMVLILIPYFLTILLDVSTLTPAMQKAVYAIPFSHPFLASPNLLLKNYEPVLLGIVYMAACFAVFVAVASRIFASDRILTMRLNLRKKRRE
jgi:ABC-2 type transport system permease protein